jgi:5'-3' exonuclease
MNHIIHSCTHAGIAKDLPDLTQEQQLQLMAMYLDNLVDLVQPQQLLVLAVDGVAPRAKMNQQRTRRFLSAHIAELTEKTGMDR